VEDAVKPFVRTRQARSARFCAGAGTFFFKVRLNFIYSPNGFSVCIHAEGRTVCIAAVLRRLCPVLPALQTLFYTNLSLFAHKSRVPNYATFLPGSVSSQTT